MKAKIREEDRRAMDIVLDRVATAAGKREGSATYAAADGHIRDRVLRVQKVLSVLDALATAEPPRDLVARTLKFVAASSGRNVAASTHSRPATVNGEPSPLA